MGNTYVENLISTVVNCSDASTWKDAVLEWKIADCEEDSSCSSRCICGKENIKYLYHIQNKCNGSQLFPIGSSCIGKFERKDLIAETELIESQFKLFHAIKDKKYLSLSTDYFSRKLLRWLYDEGAFDTEYNHHNGQSDYEYLLKMFNKRDKESISANQDRKIKAIILNSIRPFMQKKFAE